MASTKTKLPAKEKAKRPTKAKAKRIVSIVGDDGHHYTPLPGRKWLQSRLVKSGWRHTLVDKPALALSGRDGPVLMENTCSDGCQYLNEGSGWYRQMCPNGRGGWTYKTVKESEVPASCR
jgi:hypothetical protein